MQDNIQKSKEKLNSELENICVHVVINSSNYEHNIADIERLLQSNRADVEIIIDMWEGDF